MKTPSPVAARRQTAANKTRTTSPLLTAPLRQARAFDNSLAFVLSYKRMRGQERAIIVAGSEPDERLLLLTSRLNTIASNVACLAIAEPEDREMAEALLRESLAALAAYALIWSTTGQRNYVRGCKWIATERQRQRDLLITGKIIDNCAAPATDPRKKFRVLFEECGGVAHAIDQVEHHGLAPSNVHAELTQVAAVCVAWLESLEGSAARAASSGSAQRAEPHQRNGGPR